MRNEFDDLVFLEAEAMWEALSERFLRGLPFYHRPSKQHASDHSWLTLFRKGIHLPVHCTLAAGSGLYFSNDDTLYFSQMKGNLALQSARLLKSEKGEPGL